MNGRTVLITGSTDGVGRTVAERLAAGGTRVIVHGRDRTRGEAVVERIAHEGGEARFFAADLSSLAGVRALADAVRDDGDGLDALVNNAGIGTSGAGRELSADGFELRFAVNYLAGFLLTRLLLPELERREFAANRQRRLGGTTGNRLFRRDADPRLQRRPGLSAEQARANHVHLRSRRGTRRKKLRRQLPASGDFHGHDDGSLERR